MYEVSAVVFYVHLLLCCNAKVLLDCTLQPWGSTIWSQHTDTMLHWCMPLALLKLQVLLRKEFLQCGHILSPRMFKSWDRSSVQTSCAGVFFSLCLSLCPSPVSFFFSLTLHSFFVSDLSRLHLSAEGIKTFHKQFSFNVLQNISRGITPVI